MSQTIGESSACRLPSGHFTLQCLFLISYIVYKLCDLFMISPHAMFDCDKVLDSSSHYNWLVVWNMFYFSIYWEYIIIPTDEIIFFRGVGQPPTR